MGVSKKIALLQILLIVTFIVAIIINGDLFWQRNYLQQEQDDVGNNVTRTYRAWEEELNRLNSLVVDWAPWNQLYAFALNPSDHKFVNDNLSIAAMDNLEVNMMVLVDYDGKILFVKGVDLTRKDEQNVPPEVLKNISELVVLKALELHKYANISSFFVIDGQPVLFSMQQILAAKNTAGSPRVLVFAKYADENLINNISGRTQVKVAFSKKTGNFSSLQKDGYWQEFDGDKEINAYYPLIDAYGKADNYLVSTTPREAFREGQAQIKSFILITAAFGIVFIIITLLVLDRTVLARIRKMETFMDSIATEQGYSARLELPGSDELSLTAKTMNNMLDRIDRDQQKIKGLYGAVSKELDERRTIEQKLRYLNVHDQLTGLYNRAYFEQEISNLLAGKILKVGIVFVDLDGLKFINDTMGHSVGDQALIETAKTLQQSFSGNSTVARIGGDEFAIIIPDTDEEIIKQLCESIKFIFLNRDDQLGIKLSLSLGWGYFSGPDLDETILQGLIKQADDLMYRQKLSSSSSNRNALVQGMLELLRTRDYITEGHSKRLQDYTVALGRLIGLAETQITDLALLSQFHDIGKVGISDKILFKPGELTLEEKHEMERHSEIGQRIAQAVPELKPIAAFILTHHEWWNGAGYPLKISGEEIPIEARILAIADAYDAMIHDRPYRKARSVEEALAELKRCAGTQFDPELVEKFISIL